MGISASCTNLLTPMTISQPPPRVHVVAGGFPRGSAAGHDIDYARLRILQLLQEEGRATASVASDFSDLDSWLPKSDLLVTCRRTGGGKAIARKTTASITINRTQKISKRR